MALAAVVLSCALLAACGSSESAPVVPEASVRIPLNAVHVAAPAPSGSPSPASPPTWITVPGERTVLFGTPGAQALLSIACEGVGSGSPQLIVTRFAPAEPGAEALFAIQGNRRILRLPVRAVELRRDEQAWRGALYAGDERAEVFLGTEIAATVPGGGRLAMPAMGETHKVIDECRHAAGPIPSAPGLTPRTAALENGVGPGER